MLMYKISLGDRSSTVDKLYISTPRGVFDLKNKSLNGTIILSDKDYAKALLTGLKRLLAEKLINVEKVQISSTLSKRDRFHRKTDRTESKIDKSNETVISVDVPQEEPAQEEPVQEEPVQEEVKPEHIVIVDDVPAPKSKSKKKK